MCVCVGRKDWARVSGGFFWLLKKLSMQVSLNPCSSVELSALITMKWSTLEAELALEVIFSSRVS